MIRVELDKCTGCRSCETACAFYHSGKINSRAARIKLIQLFERGIDGPVVCVQCEERYCSDCPQQAIKTGAHGEVRVSPSLCNLCRKCERKCPIGAIETFGELTYVCDLCGGRPKCVAACTEGAIVYQPQQNVAVSLAEIRSSTSKMTPSEKRRFYIARQATPLRKSWGRDDD